MATSLYTFVMNKRFSVYYLVAAYCGYTAYRLIKDIQEGAPTSSAMNVITVGFFSLAAVAIVVYTTILVKREKKANQEKDTEKDSIEKDSDEGKMKESKLKDEADNDSQDQF